jgi:polyphosphate kinase
VTDVLGEATTLESRLLNRELSWLDFNERVLALAADPSIPLHERAKFCAIFSSNLDEFFQVRVAALKDQVAAELQTRSPDGRTPAQQLVEVSDRVAELVARQEDHFVAHLVPALRDAGVVLCPWDDLPLDDRKQLTELFEERVYPVLTPLVVDPAHPFPYISNLSLNLAALVRDPDTNVDRFTRVKVPPALSRFVPLADGVRFVRLEEVIAAHLPYLFPGMQVVDHWYFRVTRNADLTLEDEEAEDLLAAVEMELRRRRFGRAVRLEVEEGIPAPVLDLLRSELDLDEDDVSFHRAPIDLSGLWALHALDRPDLKDEPWPAITSARLRVAAAEEKSIFSVLREQPVLVHHPYERFATSVEEFIRTAADDPRVLSIKITLYRTSADSPIARSLARAAERGVQVAALVELKARFDEAANVAWAKELEQAGVHVVYGLVGLKTHSKCVLVVREEDTGLRRYAHVGTGNYHSATARIYEDLGLLTCDPAMGADLSELFNHLTGFSRDTRYRKLLVAPRDLRRKLLDRIAGETQLGPDGRIVMKMNSLVDTAIIDALYEASRAGVPIDLLVRGICCLRPGVEGLSQTIRVRSILGRYLEHSRIYLFGNGAGPDRPQFFIGSADLMPRNLDRRVEVLAPVETDEHQERLREVLAVELGDGVRGWELIDDTWHQVGGDAGIDAQGRLYELARERGRLPEER